MCDTLVTYSTVGPLKEKGSPHTERRKRDLASNVQFLFIEIVPFEAYACASTDRPLYLILNMMKSMYICIYYAHLAGFIVCVCGDQKYPDLRRICLPMFPWDGIIYTTVYLRDSLTYDFPSFSAIL